MFSFFFSPSHSFFLSLFLSVSLSLCLSVSLYASLYDILHIYCYDYWRYQSISCVWSKKWICRVKHPTKAGEKVIIKSCLYLLYIFFGPKGIPGIFYQIYNKYIKGDQLNMAVFIWYLVKSDFSSARYCTVHVYTGQIMHFLQDTRNTRPCLTGQPLI